MTSGAPLDPHFIVDARSVDPNNLPDDIVILGYPMPNVPANGTVRIYLTLDFSYWVDVSADDIEAHANDGNTTPAILWVKRTATITAGSRRTASLEFLAGSVADNYLGASRLSPGGLGATAGCCTSTVKSAILCP